MANLIKEDPQALVSLCQTALSNKPAWVECLFFIDQFEELFTRVSPEDQARFVRVLEVLAATPRFRILVTMRADFYAQAVENPQLASLVREGTFPVSNPTRDMLRQMIEMPAERANLRFEPGLIRVLLDDTGNDPGALALLAFALHQLYEARGANGLLSFEAYQKFGGVRGAIGQHAEQVFKRLSEGAKGARNAVFRNLVTLDERGIPTRQRILLTLVTDTGAKQELVRAFIDARLLVTSRGEGDNASLEVAHEALFRSWPALANWIHDAADDLRLGSEILKQAAAWQRVDKDYAYLLHGSRLRLALDWLPRAKSSELVGELEEQFILASKTHENSRRTRELNRLRFTTIALGILFIVIIGVLSYLISMGFSNIENELIQANMNLANESVDNEVTSMSQAMGNWSVWDDTYNFVRGEDDTYIDLNIIEEVFANVKVNAMLFYDANNALYYRRTYDPASQSFVADEGEALSSKLMQHISGNSLLISHPDESSAYEGLLSIGDTLLIAVSQPILRVDLSGFPGGTLVWGREIDGAFIDDIEERTQLDIKLIPLTDTLEADFATAYESLKSSNRSLYSAPLSSCYSSTSESGECIAGYAVYKDIYGQDAALLRVAFPRTVVAQGQITTSIGIGILLVLGIGFTILVAVAFTRFSEQPK